MQNDEENKMLKKNSVLVLLTVGSLFLLLSYAFLTFPALEAERSLTNIATQVYTLEDPDSKLSLQEVLRPENQKKFKRNTEAHIRFNNSTSAIWIKIKAPRPDLYCQLGSPNIHHATFYSPRSNGKYVKSDTGFLLPFDSREVPIDRFTFAFSLPDEWHYLRIKSDHFLNTGLTAGSLGSFFRQASARTVLYGFYAGMMLIIAAYALQVMVQSREPYFTLYFGYVLSIATINLTEKSFLFQFVWPDKAFLNFLFPMIPYGVSFCIFFFIARLFVVQKVMPVFYKVTFIGVVLLPALVTAILLFIFHNYFVAIIITQIQSGTICIVFIYMSIVAYIESPRFRSHLTAWIGGLFLFSISVIVYQLAENGILTINAVTENSILLGSSLEVLFATASITMYQKSMRDKLLFVIHKRNLILQTKVEERTAQLQLKNGRLEDLIREKEALVNIVAHDLKAPMGQAKALSLLVQKEIKENASQAHDLACRIESVSNNGLRLIQELFEVSQLESEGQNISFNIVNLKQLTRDVMDNFGPLADMKAVRLFFLSNADVRVCTHAPYVARILDNILSNAIKFSPPGSHVEIEVRDTGTQAIISVKDEGPGFQEEDMKRVFKKFQRLSAIPTAGESSNGLGLYITKTLSERINAQLSIGANGNQGSVFSVIFTYGPHDPVSGRFLEANQSS